MTSDASKLPEEVPEVPVEARAARWSGDRVAAGLRGFGPLGILAILVILAGNLVVVPLSAVLVLVWAWRSRTPWREIGYVRPRSWAGSLAVGIAFGSAFKFLMKAIVMPLLGADPINQAFHYLVGNPAALPAALYAMIVGAAGRHNLARLATPANDGAKKEDHTSPDDPQMSKRETHRGTAERKQDGSSRESLA